MRVRRKRLGAFQKVRNRTADMHNWGLFLGANSILSSFYFYKFFRQRGWSGKSHPETCRNMMSWSHHTFQTKLVNFARKCTYGTVRLCYEAYTTKQCGRCGVGNKNITRGNCAFGPDHLVCSKGDGHAVINVVSDRSIVWFISSNVHWQYSSHAADWRILESHKRFVKCMESEIVESSFAVFELFTALSIGVCAVSCLCYSVT